MLWWSDKRRKLLCMFSNICLLLVVSNNFTNVCAVISAVGGLKVGITGFEQGD